MLDFNFSSKVIIIRIDQLIFILFTNMEEKENKDNQTSLFSCCCAQAKDKKDEVNMTIEKKQR